MLSHDIQSGQEPVSLGEFPFVAAWMVRYPFSRLLTADSQPIEDAAKIKGITAGDSYVAPSGPDGVKQIELKTQNPQYIGTHLVCESHWKGSGPKVKGKPSPQLIVGTVNVTGTVDFDTEIFFDETGKQHGDLSQIIEFQGFHRASTDYLERALADYKKKAMKAWEQTGQPIKPLTFTGWICEDPVAFETPFTRSLVKPGHSNCVTYFPVSDTDMENARNALQDHPGFDAGILKPLVKYKDAGVAPLTPAEYLNQYSAPSA